MCDYQGKTKQDLEDHELTEHNNTCGSCLNYFRIPEKYDSHVCKDNCEQCLTALFGSRVLKCDECDFTVCSESCLKKHLGLSHILKCDNYDTVMKSENLLNEHVEIKHEEMGLIYNEE